MAALPVGTYRIGAFADGYIPEWYPDSLDPADASQIIVEASGSVTDINFTLEQGGTISGTVFNDWMGTEQNQVVAVWTADTLEMVTWTFSNDFDNHGSYILGDLPYGDYRISAGGPLPEGAIDPGNRNDNLVRGWWTSQGTVPTSGEAEVITITDPTPVPNIDFQLQQGGRIEGRIVDENWNGLDGATVTLEDYDTGEVFATTTSYNREGNDPGYFNFNGLSSAIDYLVWATAPTRVIRYAKMHCSGTYDRDQATRYQLNPGDNIWLNDISLPYGGSISGTVYESDGTTPIAGANVTVQSWEDTGGDAWVSVVKTTDASGTFTVPGIPLGSYRVSALATGFAIEYYAAASSVIDPTATEQVTISPGTVDVVGIDFALDAGGTISGSVSNTSQQPLAGCKIMAMPVVAETGGPAGGGDMGFYSPFVAETDATGAYSIIGLPFGDYNILAQGGANAQYVSEWYDNQLIPENATSISLLAETPDITGINFELALGGSITGIVVPDGGLPVSAQCRTTQPTWSRVYPQAATVSWREPGTGPEFTGRIPLLRQRPQQYR